MTETSLRPDWVEDADIEAAKDYLTAIIRIRHPNSPAVTEVRLDHPAVIHFAQHRIRSIADHQQDRHLVETPMTREVPMTLEQRAEAMAEKLTQQQREALRPGASDLKCLLKIGLVRWSNRPGHRYASLRLSSIGYAVRKHIYGGEDV